MDTYETNVLCSASYYNKKYYFNDMYNALPQQIKDELKIMCVLFTEEVGGVIIVEFDEEDGSLMLKTSAAEDALLYDEIGAGLKLNELRIKKRELFEAVETYYKVFFLYEDMED